MVVESTRLPARVVQALAHRALRQLQEPGQLGVAVLIEVVEDQDLAVGTRQRPEGFSDLRQQLVALHLDRQVAAVAEAVDQRLDGDRRRFGALVVGALPQDYTAQPAGEPGGLAQLGDVLPRCQESLLHGVISLHLVAEEADGAAADHAAKALHDAGEGRLAVRLAGAVVAHDAHGFDVVYHAPKSRRKAHLLPENDPISIRRRRLRQPPSLRLSL